MIKEGKIEPNYLADIESKEKNILTEEEVYNLSTTVVRGR